MAALKKGLLKFSVLGLYVSNGLQKNACVSFMNPLNDSYGIVSASPLFV